MANPTTQTITNTRLSGSQTFSFTPSQAGQTNANVTIDRTINGGLNSLTSADTLTIGIDRSFDGGTTWKPAVAITCQGGLIITKGVTLASEGFAVGMDDVTDFRISTTASTPVRIAGTIVYS